MLSVLFFAKDFMVNDISAINIGDFICLFSYYKAYYVTCNNAIWIYLLGTNKGRTSTVIRGSKGVFVPVLKIEGKFNAIQFLPSPFIMSSLFKGCLNTVSVCICIKHILVNYNK